LSRLRSTSTFRTSWSWGRSALPAAAFGRIIVRQNRKLTDGIHSHVHAQGATGAAVGIVIHDDSIDSKCVISGAAAAYGDSEAVAALRSLRIPLSLNAVAADAGLQERQLEPVASVQREFADGGRIHESA